MLVGELFIRGRSPPLRGPPPIWALVGIFIVELVVGSLVGPLAGSLVGTSIGLPSGLLVGGLFEWLRLSPLPGCKMIWAFFARPVVETLVGPANGGPEVGSLVGSAVGDAVHDEGNAVGSNTEVDVGVRIVGLSDPPKLALVTGLEVGM
jgi:hypothetical protein